MFQVVFVGRSDPGVEVLSFHQELTPWHPGGVLLVRSLVSEYEERTAPITGMNIPPVRVFFVSSADALIPRDP